MSSTWTHSPARSLVALIKHTRITSRPPKHFQHFSNVFNLSQCIEFNSVLLIYQSKIVSYIFLNFPLTLFFVLCSVGRITSGINGAGSVPVGSLFDTQGDTQRDTQAQASAHTDSGNFSNAALYNDHNHIQPTICVISFAFLVATSIFIVARHSVIHMICYVMFCFVLLEAKQGTCLIDDILLMPDPPL